MQLTQNEMAGNCAAPEQVGSNEGLGVIPAKLKRLTTQVQNAYTEGRQRLSLVRIKK